jgi:hypothetical protein
MLAQYSLHIRVGRESSFPCRLQPPINTAQLIRRGKICAPAQTGIDFKRNLRELLLRLLRPGLHPLQCVFEGFGCHVHSVGHIEMAIKVATLQGIALHTGFLI